MKNFSRRSELERGGLEAIGLSETALDVYSNSDFDVYAVGEGLYTVTIRRDPVADSLTAQELDEFFRAQTEEE